MMDIHPSLLELAGYVQFTLHGFALPCFASGLGGNTWYAARCSVEGDHLGTISGFEVLKLDNITALPPTLLRSVQIGTPWHDVLIWNDRSYVGTPEQIWAEIDPIRDELEKTAPLTLLDLGLCVKSADRRKLSKQATEFIRAQWGGSEAATWVTEILFRPAILMTLRRLLSCAASPINISQTSILVIATEAGAQIKLSTSLEVRLNRENLLEPFIAEINRLAEDFSIKVGGVSSLSNDVNGDAVVRVRDYRRPKITKYRKDETGLGYKVGEHAPVRFEGRTLMPSRYDCEDWIGDTKQDYCQKAGSNQTQRYARQTERQGAKTIYRYGWSCNYCHSFQVSYEFVE